MTGRFAFHRRAWVATMLASLPLALVWSFANPLFASPDEPAHMARAQAFAHGDFTPRYRTDGLPMEAQTCYTFNAAITADCADLTWGEDGKEVRSRTRDYPPLFHAVAGLPSLVSSGEAGAYAMRAWMALVSCALVAWGAALVLSAGVTRWAVVGPALAITPMAVFVSSTVNPSGITLGFAVVAVGALVARFLADDRGRVPIVSLVVGALGLVLVRRDGVAMVGAMTVASTPLWWHETRAWRARLRGRRWTGRDVVVAAVAAAAIVAVVVQWIAPTLHRFVTKREVGGDGTLWQGLGVMRSYFEQIIGTFGWLDTFIGPEAYTVAIGVVIAVVSMGLAGGPRRLTRTIAASVAALFVVPVAFGAFRFPYFQGRYMFPLWVLATVIAALAVDRAGLATKTATRLANLVLVVWLAVHLVGFWQNARRYSIGRPGSWNLFGDVAWEPPITNEVAVLWLAAAAVIAVFATRRLIALVEERG